MSYGHSISVALPLDAAVQSTRDALAGHGFGVIADIDIHGVFTDTLGPEAAADAGTRLRAALDDVAATARAAATRSHR